MWLHGTQGWSLAGLNGIKRRERSLNQGVQEVDGDIMIVLWKQRVSIQVLRETSTLQKPLQEQLLLMPI